MQFIRYEFRPASENIDPVQEYRNKEKFFLHKHLRYLVYDVKIVSIGT
jgi:hypothetical protein